MGTLFSLILAGLLYYNALGREIIPTAFTTSLIFIAPACLFIALQFFIPVLIWPSLQRAEHELTPRAVEMFRADNGLTLAKWWLILFPIASFALAIDLFFFNNLHTQFVFPVWLILLGISLDTFHWFLKRSLYYLDPFGIVKLFTQFAKNSIRDQKEVDLCNWIDGLSEVSVRAVQRGSLSLCNAANNELQLIGRTFLNASKSIAQESQDAQSKAVGITDKISYTLFFLLNRFEVINEKAVDQKIEPICSNLITIMGKTAIAAAQCDISLASYPLHFLGRMTKSAQEKGLQEVSPKASCTLLEVARYILTEIDITYLELQEPFFSIIANLDEIAKEMFRRDKSMSIKLLIQPFLDLKALFNEPKVAAHRDTPVILQEIDRVLAEYDALQMVMKTIPPISKG